MIGHFTLSLFLTTLLNYINAIVVNVHKKPNIFFALLSVNDQRKQLSNIHCILSFFLGYSLLSMLFTRTESQKGSKIKISLSLFLSFRLHTYILYFERAILRILLPPLTSSKPPTSKLRVLSGG